MPTGQVFRWQTRIRMQPMATSGAVEKPNSSAPEQRRDRHVAAGLETAVGLHADAAAQVVHHQGLLGLGQADLPGHARVLDRGLGRRAGAAVHAADQHAVGLALGDARRDRAHARLDTSFTRDPGVAVGVLQVVDQLGEVLDRVDVVVRRRRDQAHARRRVAHLGDGVVHLVAREARRPRRAWPPGRS